MECGIVQSVLSLHLWTTSTSMLRAHMSLSPSLAIFVSSTAKAETAYSHIDIATIEPRTKAQVYCFSILLLYLAWHGQYWDEAARVQPRLGRGSERYAGQEGHSLFLHWMFIFFIQETKHCEPYSSKAFAWIWRIQMFLMWICLWNITWIWYAS